NFWIFSDQLRRRKDNYFLMVMMCCMAFKKHNQILKETPQKPLQAFTSLFSNWNKLYVFCKALHFT
uniref:Uncharacterized protein n=1 Tax=Poecilia latipinna TaxID=48699 RepID=A0A3B3U196_9TELE